MLKKIVYLLLILSAIIFFLIAIEVQYNLFLKDKQISSKIIELTGSSALIFASIGFIILLYLKKDKEARELDNYYTSKINFDEDNFYPDQEIS